MAWERGYNLFLLKWTNLYFLAIILEMVFQTKLFHFLFTVPKQEAADTSTYKVKEYYSYNEWSFYDLENVIDAAGRRQTQPDPKVKYTHTNPWTANEKAAA